MENEELRRKVEAEIQQIPELHGRDIIVAASDRMVTLTGFVENLNLKWRAEDAAKRVSEAVAIVNDIEVRLPGMDERPDPDIAQDIAWALGHELPGLADRIVSTVENGWVTIEGEIPSPALLERATEVVGHVRGIRGLSNNLAVTPRPETEWLHQKIEDALRRQAELDARNIQIETDGKKVTLTGTVRSWAEREVAEGALRGTPGIDTVENRIVISVTGQGVAS